MSGPKCDGWDVDVNYDRERRALEDARAAAAAVRARVGDVIREYREAGLDYGSTLECDLADSPEPDRGAGRAELEEWTRALAAECERARARLHEQLTRLRAARILRAAGGDISGEAVLATDVLSAHAASSQSTARLDALSETAERVVGRLSVEVTPAARDEVCGMLAELAAASGHERRAGLLDEIRLRVQQANADAGRRREDADAADVVLIGLRGLEGSEVAAVRAELTAVVTRTRPLTEDLRARAAEVQAAAVAASDLEYVSHVVLDVLSDFGYDVGEEFATTFGTGRAVDLERSRWPGHAVRCRISGVDRQINFNVVRQGEAAASREERLRDTEIENLWCADYDRLQEELRKRGVRTDPIRHVAAGVQPVQVGQSSQRDANGRRVRRKEMHEG